MMRGEGHKKVGKNASKRHIYLSNAEYAVIVAAATNSTRVCEMQLFNAHKGIFASAYPRNNNKHNYKQ